MGLVDEQENTWMLIHTHFHGDLYQQVYIDRSVTNDTWHALLSSMGVCQTLIFFNFVFGVGWGRGVGK